MFDPVRVGAGLPDLDRVLALGTSDTDARAKAARNLGPFALASEKEGYAERLSSSGVVPPQAYTTVGAAALIQLRAAGLI